MSAAKSARSLTTTTSNTPSVSNAGLGSLAGLNPTEQRLSQWYQQGTLRDNLRHTIKSAMPSTSAPQSHPDVPDNLGMTEGAATSKLTIADLKPFIPTVSSDVVFLDQWSEKRSHESMLRSMKVVDKFKLLHETINPTRLGGMMKDIKPKTPSTRLQSMMSDRRSEEGGISDEDVEDLVSHLASSIKIHFAGKAAEAGGDEISEFGRYCSSLPEYIVLVRGGRAIDGLH